MIVAQATLDLKACKNQVRPAEPKVHIASPVFTTDSP